MTNKEFILKLLEEGKGYLKMLLPFIVGWHMPQPKWLKKKTNKEEGN